MRFEFRIVLLITEIIPPTVSFTAVVLKEVGVLIKVHVIKSNVISHVKISTVRLVGIAGYKKSFCRSQKNEM
jgi:hypothetical protein